MKQWNRVLAVLLCILLILPSQTVTAQEAVMPYDGGGVWFNTGNKEYQVVEPEDYFDRELGDAYFEEDGSYTIQIPEENPFFPYEVQFTWNGRVTREWFMTPEDSVEIGGHRFYVSAYFDDTVVTQMSLNVAGDTVVVYPEEKTFTEGDGAVEQSLLPLTEKYLTVALTGYTPAELTRVSLQSIFTGSQALQNTDKVMWTYYNGKDDFQIASSGDCINLSYNTYSPNDKRYHMIVGDDDQLASGNIRYIVTVKTTESRDWLIPTVCTQDSEGNRVMLTTSESQYSDYGEPTMRVYVPSEEFGSEREAYVSLAMNPDVFGNVNFHHLKVYEGKFNSVSEAASAMDITNKIWNRNMTQTDEGYFMTRNQEQWITVITFDAMGKETGCLPINLRLAALGNSVTLQLNELAGSSGNDIVDSYLRKYSSGCYYTTFTLYKEYAANTVYYLTMDYKDLSLITAAYLGQYASIAEAETAGASNIKSTLFGTRAAGYAADYSQGVYVTVFIGSDGDASQKVQLYNIKTETGTKSSIYQSSGTYVVFKGLKDSDGTAIPSFCVEYNEDSYGEFNYLTILVGADVDLTSLAPEYWTSSGVTLYAAGGSQPEVSGVSVHDFSNGSLQYTASSEDGSHLKNYWLRVVKAENGPAQLYVNSLGDEEADTRVEAGITYSNREMILDSYHNHVHDILLANMGTDPMASLNVQLESDTLILDDYWTLSGDYDLAGYAPPTNTIYGKMSNLAKIRIRAKDNIAAGTEVSGTLTVKSGNADLLVFTLTGTLGDPCITTTEIPQAVKYVPYGTMIQNNNKYSWNTINYSLTSGSLPAGMIIKPNGELYGVPTEAGEFTFTVRMAQSYHGFSDDTRTYTMTVVENTDPNVEGATDQGYHLTQRVQNITIGAEADQTLVSQGTYAEFVDIYLDGDKLTKGVDYQSEEGSTRITIRGQTLTDSNSTGTHTLGIEFRTSDTGSLKRAAQNYRVYGDDSDDDDDSGDTGSGNGNKDNGGGDKNNNTDNSNGNPNASENNSNQNAQDSNNPAANPSKAPENGTEGTSALEQKNEEVVYYTVEPGDTLWKIAVKFYGLGSYWEKIYKDNAGTIKNPNAIYAGQVIAVYLAGKPDTPKVQTERTSYTVKAGDTLWNIAGTIYGKGLLWRKIYEANMDTLTDPGQINVGQILRIPEE